MKKGILILLFLINLINCKAQGIASITVLNGSFITSVDTVSLKVVGGFADLGGVTSKGYSVSGSVITATINGCTVGLSTVTYVNEIIKINPLPEGTFKIIVKLIEYDNFVYPGCYVQKSYRTDSTNINVVTYTGLKENINSLANLSIFPNPVTNKVNINFDVDAVVPSKITVLNNLGQKLLQLNTTSKFNELPLNDFSPGIYFITVQNNYSQKTCKILKN